MKVIGLLQAYFLITFRALHEMLDIITPCACMARTKRAPSTEEKVWETELVTGPQVDSEAEVNQA